MRYAILHHTGWIEDHFDLMLETDATAPLLTWRLDRWPGPTSITPLPPHRRAYLTYEGPVSSNRGAVKRVAEGEYEVIGRTASVLRVRFQADGLEFVLPLSA